MCGICGFLAPDLDAETLRRMNDRLRHRGPDDDGLYLGAGVGLAARRLSIIDVPGGHQPLSNEDGSVWITYNGEIYNHADLRPALEKLGHTFRTRSDTEMIVHAYEAWGPDCVRRFCGMFAFAVWDAPRRRLFLARDRFGKKPLYYAHSNGRFLFASEIKALLQVDGILAQPDPAALRSLFSLGWIPAPRTAFLGIDQLPAAHTLLLEPGQGAAPVRYWQLEESPPPPIPFQEAVEQTRTLLREAVSVRRMSEVPLGALLSGGLDSGTVVALLQSLSSQPVHTVSIAFEQPRYDESAHARQVAAHLGTVHHTLTFTERDFDRLPEVIAHLEAPQCSATSLPIFMLYLACREAGLTVALTGEGADELFLGYHWYRGDTLARRLLALPGPARRALARAPLPISAPARRVLSGATAASSAAVRFALWQQVLPQESLNRLLTAPPGEFERPLPDAADMRSVEAATRMVDFINFEVDRMSMAHSVEARVPFLDHRLWEFVCSLPLEWLTRGRLQKSFLREVARPWLPAATLARPKWGLAAPHAAWLRRARLPDWAEAVLQPAALARTGLFVPAEAARLRAEHRTGRADHSRALWGVLTTQLWHEQLK